MAILKDVSISGSTTLKATYHIIEQVLWTKGQPVQIQTASWANETDRRLLHPVALLRLPPLHVSAMPSAPTLEEAYALLKSSPDWSGAQDG